MDSKRLINYIENSFLSPLIANGNVTDISYNGDSIFYMDNLLGRRKSNINITFESAKDFVRQIANLCEKQFSYQSPVLDVSFGRYRVSALHQSISKKGNEDVINFSIRIGAKELRINKNSGFLSPILNELINVLIDSRISLVIGGQTGTGKTELQKYFLTMMKENTRVIVVDNVMELDYLQVNPLLDLNIWLANETRKETNIQSLIKNALRSNPDWLIVAEARGEEMIDVMNSALTGHPIITTIHAMDINSMPIRMTRMVMMGDKKATYEDIFTDISYHFRFYIFLKRKTEEDGKVRRYIEEIGYLNGDQMELIYQNKNDEKYFKFSKSIIDFIDVSKCSKDFKKKFIEEQY